MTTLAPSLTGGHLLARNIVFNFVGWTLPAIAAVVAMPFLVRGLGDARFGVLALAWTVIGYFSLFDLGIGRALTHAVAERLGSGRRDEIGPAVWTSLGLLAPAAVLGGAVLALLAPWLVERVLTVPRDLHGEAVLSFRLLAVAVPFTAAAAALRGVLEAAQRFGVINALRVPYGLLTFLGPLAVLPFTRHLAAAVAVLVGGRVVLCAAYLVMCRSAVPEVSAGRFRGDLARSLLSYGGWTTVSNVISPLMNTFDRFAIAALLNVSLVTYYAAPSELVTKMWLYTAATLPVFFPALAASAARDGSRTAHLFDRGLRITLAGLMVPTLLLVVLSREILSAWLGPDFAAQSPAVLQILAIAIFINCVGQCAYTLIQASGRPDLTGKYHAAELPAYAVLLWLLLDRYGIVGVAAAWAVRAAGDAALLLVTCSRLVPETRPVVGRAGRWLALLVPVIAASALVPGPAARAVTAAALSAAGGWLAWRRLLTDSERDAALTALSAVLPRRSA